MSDIPHRTGPWSKPAKRRGDWNVARLAAPRRKPRRRGFKPQRCYGMIALTLIAGIGAWENFSPALASLPPMPLTSRAQVVDQQFSLCGSGRRSTCVVDGDTFWLSGTKIRIADINTPETSSPQCAAEARRGKAATLRLRSLLSAGPFELRRGTRDEDRYGRKLRTVHRDGRSLGAMLVAEGLAHKWNGRMENWCG